MTGLVMHHGWGLDGRFFTPLAEALSAYPQALADSGYTGRPWLPIRRGETAWVGIGHSLGFARLLEEVAMAPGRYRALVALGGFTRFCETMPGSGGTPPRVLARMLRAFAKAPVEVLADFLQRSDLIHLMPESPSCLDLPRLAQDLTRLAMLDMQQQLAACPLPVLVLASRDDPIVPPALTEACFAEHPLARLVWCEQGGHALGHAEAAWCADQIGRFIAQLPDGK